MLFIYGLVSRALHVKQLLLHFLISGDAFGAGRGSQRRLSSRSILCVIFESSSLARVSHTEDRRRERVLGSRP